MLDRLPATISVHIRPTLTGHNHVLASSRQRCPKNVGFICLKLPALQAHLDNREVTMIRVFPRSTMRWCIDGESSLEHAVELESEQTCAPKDQRARLVEGVFKLSLQAHRLICSAPSRVVSRLSRCVAFGPACGLASPSVASARARLLHAGGARKEAAKRGKSKQFNTRSFGTPPLRAISTPQWVRSISSVECASGLMLIMQHVQARARAIANPGRAAMDWH